MHLTYFITGEEQDVWAARAGVPALFFQAEGCPMASGHLPEQITGWLLHGENLLDTDSLGDTHGLWLCDFSWYEVLGAEVLFSWEQQGCRKQWFSPS